MREEMACLPWVLWSLPLVSCSYEEPLRLFSIAISDFHGKKSDFLV